MSKLSALAVPLIIILILSHSFIKRTASLTSFSEGVKTGLSTMINIFPSLLALITAIELMNISGLTGALTTLLSPVFEFFQIPAEISPLVLLRPVSGSGSTAVLQSILKKYTPDSFAGLCACVIAGSTETTFYTLAVYFAATKVKHTRHTALASLFADFICAVAGCRICSLFFK